MKNACTAGYTFVDRLFCHPFNYVLIKSLMLLLFVCFPVQRFHLSVATKLVKCKVSIKYCWVSLINFMFLDNRRSVPTIHLDVEAFDCSSLASKLAENNKTTARRVENTPRMFHSVTRECCKRAYVQNCFATNPLSERTNAIFYCFPSALISSKQEIPIWDAMIVYFGLNVTDQLQCFQHRISAVKRGIQWKFRRHLFNL